MRNGIAKGKQSLGFAEAPYLLSAGTIVGQKESQGPLGKLFDERGQDKNNLFGKTTWEEAESEMQKREAHGQWKNWDPWRQDPLSLWR